MTEGTVKGAGTLQPDEPLYIAGHRGLVGSALIRHYERKGHRNFVTATSAELDLRDQAAARAFFETKRPAQVILAAAKVGGILANSTYPAQFIYDNLMIGTNVIECCRQYGVRKLLNLGSSCIYPRMASQPLQESALLTGPLEETNRAYAVAKIAAIEMCDHYRKQYGCDFISAMPTNLYGPGDNFDPETSHVIPALIRKFVEATRDEAPEVTLWGSGKVYREFLHVDDLASACATLMRDFSEPGPINVGTGEDLTIEALATLIAEVTGFTGSLNWDTSKPDGTPRKRLDIARLKETGWSPKVELRDGIADATRWFSEHVLQ